MFEIICTKLLVCLDPTITDFTICLPNLTWSYDFFFFYLSFTTFSWWFSRRDLFFGGMVFWWPFKETTTTSVTSNKGIRVNSWSLFFYSWQSPWHRWRSVRLTIPYAEPGQGSFSRFCSRRVPYDRFHASPWSFFAEMKCSFLWDPCVEYSMYICVDVCRKWPTFVLMFDGKFLDVR